MSFEPEREQADDERLARLIKRVRKPRDADQSKRKRPRWGPQPRRGPRSFRVQIARDGAPELREID